MKVFIPFKERFKEDMLQDKKTCTSCTKKYGMPGDTFEIFGAKFYIYFLILIPLRVVAADFYKAEGFQSPQEFIKTWCTIHPVKDYDPEQKVYVHEFKRIKEGEQDANNI